MDDRRTTRRTRVAAAALAVVAVVAGFSLGYLIATRPSRAPGLLEASPAAPGTSATVPSTNVPATAPPATSRPTTTVDTVPDVTTTTAAPPSSPPPTPAPTTAPVVVTVAPPVTRPPTTPAPPRVEVLYLPDAFNRVVIPRVGTATLTIRNTGGVASQWLITGSGFTIRGPTLGTLQPGQSVDVPVAAPPNVPKSGTTGTISVLGAVNPSIPFVIRPG